MPSAQHKVAKFSGAHWELNLTWKSGPFLRIYVGSEIFWKIRPGSLVLSLWKAMPWCLGMTETLPLFGKCSFPFWVALEFNCCHAPLVMQYSREQIVFVQMFGELLQIPHIPTFAWEAGELISKHFHCSSLIILLQSAASHWEESLLALQIRCISW